MWCCRIDPVKPPEGELDWPAVEPHNTHHVLVDELDPIPGLKDLNPFRGFFQLHLNPFLEILHHFLPRNFSFLHLEYQMLISNIVHPWDFLGGSGRGVLKLS